MKSITQISLTKQVLIFALSLIVLRIFKIENIGVLFLIWNLFLAWIPLFFIQQMDVFKSNYWKISILFLTILFLPNSIYIFTDIFHLKKNLVAPIWYDLVLFLTFSTCSRCGSTDKQQMTLSRVKEGGIDRMRFFFIFWHEENLLSRTKRRRLLDDDGDLTTVGMAWKYAKRFLHDFIYVKRE